MKAATFNANSIRARIEIVIDWIKSEQPDLLCLQETKVQDQDFPAGLFEEMGYEAIFKGQKSYNGVAVITKLPLNKVRKNLFDDNNEQARFISAEFDGFDVINVYVPQGFEVGSEKFIYKLNWLEKLLAYISNDFQPDMPVILTGDFNVALEPIDLYDPDGFKGKVGFNPDEQSLMSRFFEWGFVDIFRQHNTEGGHYTFWDYRIPSAFKRKMGWRIDYILATRPLAEKAVKVWIDTEPRNREKPSDHTFLVAEFDT
ncbi:exodeoxyribonuclease III [Thermodesulfobacteriota bacterium]